MAALELIPLFSGSSGNSTLIKAGSRNILIDAGRNCKQVCCALEAVGISPDSIDAIFITHAHHDHLDALDVFVRKYPADIYATSSTHKYIARKCTKPHPESKDVIIEPGQEIDLGDGVKVLSCSTPHDAAGSVCYKVMYGGRSLMVMTDLGYVTDDIREMSRGVDGVLIEANYDKRMLVYGPYPEDLKARIAGDKGHLSNDACAEMIRDMIDCGTYNFILGHLSENNNTHEKAYLTVTEYLRRFKLEQSVNYNIAVANRYEPTKGIEI